MSSKISSGANPSSTFVASRSSSPTAFTSSDFLSGSPDSTFAPPASAIATTIATLTAATSATIPAKAIDTASFAISSTTNHFTPNFSNAAVAPTSVPPSNIFPATSSGVSHRPEAPHNQNGLSQGVIAIIASFSFIFLLALVACIVLLLRRRRKRLSQNNGGGSKNIDSEEKFTDQSPYTPYNFHRKSLLDQGMAPLLDIPSIGQHSRSTSSSSVPESHLYHDGPTSPFLNESEKRAEINAVSISETTPFSTHPGYGASDAIVLMPATPPRPRSVNKPPALQIPESNVTIPPSRRPSKGKAWKRGSNINVTPESGYDSDDSASLYSQASASTHRTYATRQSTIQPFPYPSMPLPSIPQSPSNKVPIVSKFEGPAGGSLVTSGYRASPIDLGQEEEGNGGLGKEETLLVATLLQSRLSRVPNPAAPTRSSSVVSHIERAGSIKPVLTSLETGAVSRYPRSRARRARDAVKSQILTSDTRAEPNPQNS